MGRMNCHRSPRRLLLPLPLPLPPLELGLLSGALLLKLVADPPAPDEEEEDDEVGSLATSSCLRSIAIRGVGACMVNTARTAQKKKTPAGQNPCCRVGRLN